MYMCARKDIVERTKNVVVKDDCLSFIASFNGTRNAQIIAILCAYFSNGYSNPIDFVKKINEEKFKGNPLYYIGEYDYWDIPNFCLYENISELNFARLLIIINNEILCHYDIFNAHHAYMSSTKLKCKYAHEGFARMFGHNTHFPNIDNRGTFYRYNLIFYWLVYKLKIWKGIDTSTILLPCNDIVFSNAKKFGVTKTRLKATLSGTIKLTRIAREIFGDDEFWKLYELLNYSEL